MTFRIHILSSTVGRSKEADRREVGQLEPKKLSFFRKEAVREFSCGNQLFFEDAESFLLFG